MAVSVTAVRRRQAIVRFHRLAHELVHLSELDPEAIPEMIAELAKPQLALAQLARRADIARLPIHRIADALIDAGVQLKEDR